MSNLKHIAIVMDGNGRWATEKGLNRLKGHQKGVEVVDDITTYCRDINLPMLTLYAFSEENWERPKEEVNGLMQLLADFMINKREKMLKNNIHFNPIGNLKKLPDFVLDILYQLEEETKPNSKMDLNIALSYSGKQDIVFAAKKMVENNIEITEENFSKHLLTNDVDLLIRTGGDIRISNFLLWQIAYAELYFEKKYWPDFTPADLQHIIDIFSQRERRFGKIN